MCIYSWYLHH